MNSVETKILSWWGRTLDREAARGRALSARLRRATPVEVLCEPEVHDLAQAEVRSHGGRSLAQACGGPEPVLSPLRFQRLMRASDGDLAVGLRRAIPMVGRTCNVARLGRDLLFWNEITRTRWCFDYFGAEAPREVSEGTQP
jgi:CRISPR system Cascade subunit CasB